MAGGAETVLVVDDSQFGRSLLLYSLETLGYRVRSAADGVEAWEILQAEPISLVVTDWQMPRMDGLELCRRIRAGLADRFVYVVLVTATMDDEAALAGLEAGADDFLHKPVSLPKLRARLASGRRILELQRTVEAEARRVAAAHAELSAAYDTIERDLRSAAGLQQGLLPAPGRIGRLAYDWVFEPSSALSGDTLGVAGLGADWAGFFHIDVAGHGIPAALTSFSVHHLLARGRGAVPETPPGDPAAAPFWLNPAAVVAELNRHAQSSPDSAYFTMVYGVVHLPSGWTALTQAGHPAPLRVARGGRAAAVGGGGFPVGLIEGAEYEVETLTLAPGDRLVLHSDGLTECFAPDGEPFGEERLAALLAEAGPLPLDAAMAAIRARLRDWRGGGGYDDDVTLLALELTEQP